MEVNNIKITFLFLKLTLLVILFSCQNETGIQGNNNSNNTIIMGDNVTVNPLTNEEDKEVDIIGKWNSDIASDIITDILNKDTSKIDQYTRFKDNCLHTIIGFYLVEISNKTQMIGVTTSRSEIDDCHGCPVALSFFEFTQYDTGWKLEEKRLATLYSGQYGQLHGGDGNMAFFPIGHNKYCFTLDHLDDTDDGIVFAYTRIYTYIADELKLVFGYDSFADDSEAIEIDENGNIFKYDFDIPRFSYDSKIEVLKTGQIGLYDLKITTKGIKSDTLIDTTIIYKFNGSVYKPNPVFE